MTTPGIVTSVVTIRGMIAVHSVRAVFTALAGVDGILRADVELGRATVEHDGRATPERLREAIAVAGCEVEDVVEERRRLPVV
ncbi:MAG TPA: heavy-metal-associated domain-containing protein [Gemmatimonadaceae bacterium]|nr:heavy-metal-associated domain-containing protein [Gemmatimonadaceae bacterium]